MTYHEKRLCQVTLLLFFFLTPMAVRAQLSKEDHEAAKNMISGTLYLRLQAPQKYGVGAWATYSESMLEASPTRVSTDRKLAEPLKHLMRNGYHLKNEEVYWGFLANTLVDHCKLVSEKGILVVWCDRAGSQRTISPLTLSRSGTWMTSPKHLTWLFQKFLCKMSILSGRPMCGPRSPQASWSWA